MLALSQAALFVLALLAGAYVDLWLSAFMLVGGVPLYLWDRR